jgi:hypothetical protein
MTSSTDLSAGRGQVIVAGVLSGRLEDDAAGNV